MAMALDKTLLITKKGIVHKMKLNVFLDSPFSRVQSNALAMK